MERDEIALRLRTVAERFEALVPALPYERDAEALRLAGVELERVGELEKALQDTLEAWSSGEWAGGERARVLRAYVRELLGTSGTSA
jgi:hypothetical protein